MPAHQFPRDTHAPHCCPHVDAAGASGVSRRTFLTGLGGAALGATWLGELTWAGLTAAVRPDGPPPRRALKVQPVLTYETPQRRPQTSWRSWGGIQTAEDVQKEVARIGDELEKLRAAGDFPIEFLPAAAVRTPAEAAGIGGLAQADALLVYAAGGWLNMFEPLAAAKKPTIFFVRHRSGPVYLWYEIIHPRYLRGHTDKLVVPGIDFEDVVVDAQDELLWRLRALCGLANARGTRIVAVGGPAGWECPQAPELARERLGLDIRTVSYDQLGKLIQEARADGSAVRRAEERAAEYLRDPGVKLETERGFVENAFLLEDVFRSILAEAGAAAITINSCMGTIMPLAETSACLTLSLLNDAGYLAFCESDFVVIPSGLLLAAIAGRPVFLNDPTYAHDGMITLAHCTAPRRMDGKSCEPARILTHFESDYGAAPKVELRKGQAVTMIAPDFAAQRWMGLVGEVADNPFLDICRSQVDVRFGVPAERVNAAMPGFHWMLAYGDYHREIGYALKRLGIAWDFLA